MPNLIFGRDCLSLPNIKTKQTRATIILIISEPLSSHKAVSGTSVVYSRCILDSEQFLAPLWYIPGVHWTMHKLIISLMRANV